MKTIEISGEQICMRFRKTVLTAVALFALAAALALCQTQTLSHNDSRIEIRLERKQGKDWVAVAPGLVFLQNDLIRFTVKTNFSGYLYVLNHGTSGEYTLLFPAPETGRENKIEAQKSYAVPATEGSFRITGPAGHEVVYWLVSPVELKPEEVRPEYLPLPPPPREKKTPAKLIPRCDDQMFRARGDCIDASAGARVVEKEEALPDNLAGISVLASRELSFERQPQASVVSVPQSLKQPVIFEFRLAHR